MKRKYYILGVLATLCLLGTGYYAWTLYDAYRKQVAEWNEGAKAAFEEALWLEVNKRAEVPLNYSSSGEHGMTTLKERTSDSVSVMTMEGFRKYKIDRSKYENSLIKEAMRRGHLGALLKKYPLTIDALSVCWDSIMSEKQISASSQIRYIYTDLALQNDTSFSVMKERFSHLDSLTVKYMGFRCEHELVAFVSYPYWMDGLISTDCCILLLPWILFILLVVYFPRLESLAKRKLTHEKVIEKEIIVEKEIHVADVQIDKADILKLPDETRFDTFAKVLSRGDVKRNIQPQSVSLLKLFLSKSDYKVTSEEISWELWQEKREKDRLYSAIRRLRNDLKAVKSVLIISCTDGDYELKTPISSNISDQN